MKILMSQGALLRPLAVFLIMFAMGMPWCVSDAVSAPEGAGVRVLRSASELPYPPFALVTPEGEADGFSVELLRSVVHSVGMGITFKVGPWGEIKQELADGRIDVLPLVSYSEDRDKIYDFTASYLRLYGTIFVREEDEDSIKREEDLQGREVIVMRGDTAHEYAVANKLTDKLILTDNYEQAMQLLADGKHDAVLVQQVVGWLLLKEMQLDNIVDIQLANQVEFQPKSGPLVGFQQRFCFAVKEGDQELVKALNEGLAIVYANGTYDALYNKWFAPITPELPVSIEKVLRYVLIVLLPALALISLGWLLFLRSEVKRKTSHLKQEIEERKRIEAALVKMERKWRYILVNLPLVGVGLDPQGRIEFVNAKFLDLTGWNESEVMGKDWFDTFLLGHERDQVREVFGKVMDQHHEEGFSTFENAILTKDGEERTIYWANVLSVDVNGQVTDVMSLGIDLTEQRHAERELARAHAKLAFHVENSPLGVLEWKKGENIVFWSHQAEAIFGWSEEEVVGKNWNDIKFIHPEDYRVAAAALLNLFEGRETFNSVECRNYTRDGSVLHCRWFNSALRDDDGNMVSLLCQIADVTELKHYQQSLLVAKEKAEAASRAKSEFLANMSHEIRTPLNGLMGMLQLLRRSAPTEEQDEYLEHALLASNRLTKLLSDILDLSRVEARKMDIASEPFDIHDALNGAVQLFSPTAQEKNLELTLDADPDIPAVVVGDVVRVQQVLNNLVGNALKFTEEGGITIKASLQPSVVEDQCRVEFTVSDTGIGIAREALERLFEPFTQADMTFNRRYQGAGLGLSISKRLVELMGGTMSAKSVPGSGSVFTFRLPFGQTEEGVARVEVKPAPTPAECHMVLLAEDDETSQVVTKRVLEKLGCTVRVVADGQAALEALQEDAFDVVLMDVQMPIMDGVEATLAIRQGAAGEDNRDIPIIAMTAYAMQEDRNHFLDVGMNGYVAKPIDIDNVITVLGQYWGKSDRT